MPRKWLRNPYIFFLPCLLFYSMIVVVFSREALSVDEPSYLGFAQNLLKGYYSPAPPDIDLWHGPGYPILIAPLVAIAAPLLMIRLLNAVLLYLSVVLFYKLIGRFMDFTKALILSIGFAGYWLAYKGLPVIMTETFMFFLVMLTAFVAEHYFRSSKAITTSFFLLAVCIAFLALTKVLFGYVIAAAFVLCLTAAIIYRRRNFCKASMVLALALLVCCPYLRYTYSLTGKIFYWGNSGGSSFYWLTNPHPGEYGDWFNSNLEPNGSIDGNDPEASIKMEKNHGKELAAILHLKGVDQDEAFKHAAMNNIRHHPIKFVQNWLSNVTRLLFNFPFSYRKSGPGLLINAFPNLILLILTGRFFPVTRRYWLHVPPFIKFILLLAIIYCFLSSFFSGAIRMFYVVFPAFAVWLAYAHTINRDSDN